MAKNNKNKKAENVPEEKQEAAVTIYIDADRKEYFKCSMYYMRKYFGVREIILLSVLFAIGLALTLAFGFFYVLILFGVSVFIMLIAVVLFVVTSRGGYTLDVLKRGIKRQKLEFNEDALLVTNMDENGQPVFVETHYYDKIDKVSIEPKRIYIYAQVSVFYYIFAKHYDVETREQLVDFLKSHLNEEVMKMKKTYRIYPKKKKLTLEEEEK